MPLSSNNNILPFLTTVIILTMVHAKLYPRSKLVTNTLLQHGSGQVTNHFRLEVPSVPQNLTSRLRTDKSDVLTSYKITIYTLSKMRYDVYVHMSFDRFPGLFSYRLYIVTQDAEREPQSHSFDGLHEVHGAVFYSPGLRKRVILSGTSGHPIVFPEFMGPGSTGRTFQSIVYPLSTNLSHAVVHTSNRFHKTILLRPEDISLHGKFITIRPTNFFTVPGGVDVHIRIPDLSVDGVEFETALAVKMRSTTPPPLVMGSSDAIKVTVDSVEELHFDLTMYNIRKDFLELVARVHNRTYVACMEQSELGEGKQRIRFKGSMRKTGVAEVANHRHDPFVRARYANGLSVRAEHVGPELHFHYFGLPKDASMERWKTALIGVIVSLVIVLFGAHLAHLAIRRFRIHRTLPKISVVKMATRRLTRRISKSV